MRRSPLPWSSSPASPCSLPGYSAGNEGQVPVTSDGPAAARPTADPDRLVLFYVAQNGLGLITQERRVTQLGRQDTLARARRVAEEQLGEAPAPLASPFPKGTRVRAVYLTPAGDAFVDLSLEVSRGHQGGSLDELLTVYALVNALTTNVPEVSAVQIWLTARSRYTGRSRRSPPPARRQHEVGDRLGRRSNIRTGNRGHRGGMTSVSNTTTQPVRPDGREPSSYALRG